MTTSSELKFQIKNNNYVTLTDFLNQHVFNNLVNAGLFAPLSIILRYFMKALLSLKTTVVPIELGPKKSYSWGTLIVFKWDENMPALETWQYNW